MFVLQNAPASPLERPGLSVVLVPVSRGSVTVTYEFALALTETPDGFSAGLDFWRLRLAMAILQAEAVPVRGSNRNSWCHRMAR